MPSRDSCAVCAYLPATDDLAAKLRETQPPLFGVKSRASLTEFDILGFSLSYELGATNITFNVGLSLDFLDVAGEAEGRGSKVTIDFCSWADGYIEC